MTDLILPGKLTDPALQFEDDPRADPRLREAIALVGWSTDVAPLSATASYEECLDYSQAFEAAAAQAYPLMHAAMPDYPAVQTRIQVIKGSAGHDITLYIYRPDTKGLVPGMVHLHGGGMVLMTAQDPSNIRWCKSLAARGMLVIAVEFRNGGGSLGNHPFPAGLNDCADAIQWVDSNRAALGLSCLIVSGESGGGNLSLAVALKAKTEDWCKQIDGVFAMCPYIYGGYAEPAGELVSIRENNGYLIDCDMMAALVKVYDPSGDNQTNPLAWPFHASVNDLRGLPPHVISVNELDPLRDEGLAYYRKLRQAEVTCAARTVHGTPHAGDMGFPDITPDLYQETQDALYRFALNVAD